MPFFIWSSISLFYCCCCCITSAAECSVLSWKTILCFLHCSLLMLLFLSGCFITLYMGRPVDPPAHHFNHSSLKLLRRICLTVCMLVAVFISSFSSFRSSLILDWDSGFSDKVCCLSEGLHSTVQFLFKGGGCWPHFFPQIFLLRAVLQDMFCRHICQTTVAQAGVFILPGSYDVILQTASC